MLLETSVFISVLAGVASFWSGIISDLAQDFFFIFVIVTFIVGCPIISVSCDHLQPIPSNQEVVPSFSSLVKTFVCMISHDETLSLSLRTGVFYEFCFHFSSSSSALIGFCQKFSTESIFLPVQVNQWSPMGQGRLQRFGKITSLLLLAFICCLPVEIA